MSRHGLAMTGFFMGEKLKYYLILHLIVMIWGITGILGDEISLTAGEITFYRTLISLASLILVGLFIKKKVKITGLQIAMVTGTGVIVGLHWYCFFYSIKMSTVSIGVVCMSSSTLFTSILEPIIFKRKFLFSEFLLSLCIIAGIVIIFGFEAQYYLGICFGLISAYLAALFTVINGRLIKKVSSFNITKYEMLGATITLFFILLFSDRINLNLLDISNTNLFYLSILGIVCTTMAFMVSVWVMKFVTPFTVSMSVNMEPIYTIIIALGLASYRGTNKEQMSGGFYLGASIILISIFANAYLKKRAKNKTVQEKTV